MGAKGSIVRYIWVQDTLTDILSKNIERESRRILPRKTRLPLQKRIGGKNMKKEPLKNKTLAIKNKNTPIIWLKNKEEDIIFSRTRIHLQEDIKSAVEWLKDRIIKDVMYDFPAGWQSDNVKKLLKLVDEAFEDVRER